MGPTCPWCNKKYFAPFTEVTAPISVHSIPNGFFTRKSDGKKVQRFRCLKCRRSFSHATLRPTYRQKKRRINSKVFGLLCSGVSMRRSAILVGVDPKTIARKLVWLAKLENSRHWRMMEREFKDHPIEKVDFDDMESSIHTKLKPVCMALLAETESRVIIDHQVASIPAKGLLAKKALKKYGRRPNHRESAWNKVLKRSKPYLDPEVIAKSDSHLLYPKVLDRHLPNATHVRYKSRKGCVVGQGELKSGGFDPLFTINHTAAMLRASVNRLFRRTWNTSKKRCRLQAHMTLYRSWHNRMILKARDGSRPKKLLEISS